MRLTLQPSRPVGAPDGTMAGPAPFIERPPLFVYDPHETGLGRGLERGWTTPRTPLAWRAVTAARLIGQRLIVDRDGQIILDEVLDSDAQCRAQLERFTDRSTSLFHEDTDLVLQDGAFTSQRLDQPDRRIDEPVLSLLSIEPSNYGSWLFRVLPKLLFLERLGPDCKVACWCPAPWQKSLLGFFGISEDRILDINLGACYQFREIHVPVVLNPFAYLGEDSCRFYSQSLERHGIERRRDKLVYISRQSRAALGGFSNVRHFLDEPRLIDQLSTAGFDIVEPEMMTIEQQVRLFASTALVVGASGAGMFNTVFCAPGTGVVDIEAFPHWLYAHCNYFSSCGHTYGIAFGAADPSDTSATHKRWTIDVTGLERKIRQLQEIMV